ncbi:hypothetical protein [Actinomadura rupiterrae]|uniref:hypothetical protein n=1 Tax=Actinomadura rupiterrae TaxID=559627 RepID=UPI0020A29E21|nr:hypothetical protein [Actinomadura rupiterrae]MCP2337821.1 hypothetical protein [Actinomadura rupiterrae]
MGLIVRPSDLDAWRARRLLLRLADDLRSHGWTTDPRMSEFPPMLRVRAPELASIGDTVTAVRHLDGWWFRTSGGRNFAHATDTASAASAIDAYLRPWLDAALAYDARVVPMKRQR